MILTVHQKGNGTKFKLGTLDYKVIAPPKPTIAMYVNNKEFTNQAINTADNIKIVVEPDASFAKQLPHDAKYQIKGLTVLRKEGLGSAKPITSKQASSPAEKTAISFNLLADWPNPKKGEVLYIEIKGIDRVNYANKHIEQDFGIRELTLNGTIK